MCWKRIWPHTVFVNYMCFSCQNDNYLPLSTSYWGCNSIFDACLTIWVLSHGLVCLSWAIPIMHFCASRCFPFSSCCACPASCHWILWRSTRWWASTPNPPSLWQRHMELNPLTSYSAFLGSRWCLGSAFSQKQQAFSLQCLCCWTTNIAVLFFLLCCISPDMSARVLPTVGVQCCVFRGSCISNRCCQENDPVALRVII